MTSSRSQADFTIPTSFPNLFLSPDGETPSGGETPPQAKTGRGDSGGEDDGIDPDTVVEVDGEPVKIGSLVEARRASKNAEAVRAAARTLANARASDDDRRAAARVVALADGIKEDELESAIDQMLGEDDPEDEDDPVPTPKPRRKQKARREAKEPAGDDSTAKDLAALRAEMLEDKTKRLGERLKEAAVEALHSVDGIEDFVKQMQKPRQVTGKDGKRRAESEDEVTTRVQKWYDRSVQSIIANSTRAMQQRKAREGRFDEGWIGEAATAVATEEFEYLKSAVGEANLIGRSTETESEVSALLSSAPPPKPSYKAGMSVEQIMEQARASLADAAARDAADSLNGGPTRA